MGKRRIGLLTRRDYFPDRRARVVIHRQVRQLPMGLHRHEFFEIAIMLSGSGVHFTERFRHQVEAGDVLVLTHRRPHGYEQTRDLNLINILIRGDLVGRLGRELGDLPAYHTLFTLPSTRRRQPDYVSHLHLAPDELAQIEEWAGRLEEETFQRGQAGSVLAEAYLILIVGLLCRRYGKKTGLPMRSEGRFGRLLSWMEKELHRSISVADLAAKMAMSERTLHRRFRDAVGMTPAAYLRQTRLRLAAQQLGRGQGENRRIGEVASACGFEDSNYFSRCFRKLVGQTPRDYQKRFRQK